MEVHNHNLNIHYTAPKEIWDKLEVLYTEMPHWQESVVPGAWQWQWYGGDDGKLVEVSVEPSGLSFYAKLPQQEWDEWFSIFKTRASDIVGYEVGELEDGFEFHYYD